MKKINSFIANRGSALIITLLVVATLTGLTIAFSEDSSIELTLAGFSKNGHRAHQMGRSAIHHALALLDQDKERNMDSLNEDWSRFGVDSFPEEIPVGLTFSGRIVDENRKININYLRKSTGEIDEKRAEQFLRLFRILGLEENLLDPILDWLDGDDIKRLYGAENDYYESLEGPYSSSNSPLPTIGQIFMVKGIGEISSFGERGEKRLLDYLTIYSDGKININTASPEVLQSLDEGIDNVLAQAIIDHRREEDFLTIDDLRKVSGIDEELYGQIRELITVKSSFFTVEVTGGSQEAVSSIKAIALRETNRLLLIYWQVV
jgi:general secretion pathway protein K